MSARRSHSRSRSRRSAREAGFSLVELLVSLVVLGLMSAMMLQGLGAGQRVWERVDRRIAAVESVEAAQTIVRERLEGLIPVTRYDANQPYPDVEGERDVMYFYGTAPEGDRPDAIAFHRLSLSTGAELVLSRVSDVAPWDEAAGSRSEAARVDEVLLRNVSAVEFEYFGQAPPDFLRRWHESWKQQARAPEAIRMRVRFPDRDPRFWPALVVRPVVTIDTNCVLSLASGRCKGR